MVRRPISRGGGHNPLMTSPTRATQPVFDESFVPARSKYFLTFLDESVEKSFLAYMHPRPRRFFTILYMSGVVGLIALAWLTPDTAPFALTHASCYFIFLLLQLTVQYMHKKRQPDAVTYASTLGQIERIILTVALGVSETVDFGSVMYHYYRNCTILSTIALDDSKFFVEPVTCSRWWSPFEVANISLLVSFRIIPYRWIAVLSTYVVVLIYVLWMVWPPPDMLWHVWLNGLYNAGGLAFICIVSYNYENESRNRFLVYWRLQQQERSLKIARQRLTAVCNTLLPPAMLSRLHRFDPEHPLDDTERAAVLTVGVHNFGVWCTTLVPQEAAVYTEHVHEAFRDITRSCAMDAFGALGDVIFAATDLLRQTGTHPERALLASRKLKETRAAKRLPSLATAVHVGPLSGGFVASGRVRYAVFGPAYDEAMRALTECPADEILASRAVLEELCASDELYESARSIKIDLSVASGGDSGSNPSGSTSAIDTDFSAKIGGGTAPGNSHSHSGSTSLVPVTEFFVVPDKAVLPPRSTTQSSATGAPETAVNLGEEDAEGSDEHVPAIHATIESLVVGSGDDQFGPAYTAIAEEERNAMSHQRSALESKVKSMTATHTIWCCFPQFSDPAIEAEFEIERMGQLPTAASNSWLAYAAYVTLLLCLMLIEVPQNGRGNAAVVLMVGSIVLAIALSTVPRLLSREAMTSKFFAWSVTGVVSPLLVVYGAALSRPSAVGNDVRLFMLLGAMMRSYCFSSTRWQAVFVPLALLASAGQYLLPGAYLRDTIILAWVHTAFTVVAERRREEAQREAFRRVQEEKLVVAQMKSVDSLTRGLLRSAVPRAVFATIGSGVSESRAVRVEAVVLLVDASSRVTTHSSLQGIAKQFAPLERMIASSHHLAISGIQGNRALVVGPVAAAHAEVSLTKQLVPAAVAEAFRLCRALDRSDGFGVLMDNDTVVHAIMSGVSLSYNALGVGTTRLLAIAAGLDSAVFQGALLTERLAKVAREELEGCDVSLVGPMKIRGAGMVRLQRVTEWNLSASN